MKEQILYLDPHDDYHSARDKIGWAQTDRILLVWPSRQRVRRLNRQLDLLLLQRHAAKLGAKLAFVTADLVVCDHADALGIAVFDSVNDSHLHPWRLRRAARPVRPPKPKAEPEDERPLFAWPKPKWLQSRAVRWLAGGIVFVIAISTITILLALALPTAHITLIPQQQTLNAGMTITADPAQAEVDAAARVIPAKTVTVVLTGSNEVSTTGSVDEATAKAGGTVTFTNLTNQAVRIPAGTAVRTTGGNPVQFVIQKDVTLEARRGAVGEAPILSSEPGPAGNVEAGLINSVEGPLSVQAAVVNAAPTTGGDVKQVAAVTDDDRARAKEELLAQLRQQGYAELLARLKEGQFAPVLTVNIVRVLDETYDRFVGEKADRLQLEMRAEVGVTIVDEAQAFAVGQAQIESQLGDNLALIPNTLTVARSDTIIVNEAGRIQFDITASAKAGASINPDEVRESARWQAADQIANVLYNSLPVAQKPGVIIWPNWFQRMPWLAWRIEVEIKPEE
ncbi:MAG: hypothetical protein HYZ49_14155 [Chloroflexi bacterium]|nr:hypothetical protein [Chloroflexota bacterium]